MYQPKVVEFLKAALECSVYLAPTEPGLSPEEIFEAGKRGGFQQGEISDALPRATTEYFGKSTRLQPETNPMWAHFVMPQVPEYRNVRAFDFLQAQFNEALKIHGVSHAKIERSVLVAQAVAKGISALDIQVAITISTMCDILVEKDGILSSRHGLVHQVPPSEQPKHKMAPIRKLTLEQAYPIVKDVIERRSDGRPAKSEPLDAFSDVLTSLGYGPFRLWWIQMVSELRQSNPQTSPVSTLVLSAALVEGSLTFVVKHARNKGLGVFRSKDFEGLPRTWKIDDLVKSAATGGQSAILDENSRVRAAELIHTRQRIHAGRMLSEFPNGPRDLRPEEPRDAKATADLVVRRVLDWLERNPVP